MMICLVVTIVICFSWYLLISACQADFVIPQKILVSSLFATAQIIGTVLLLGLAGWLYAGSLLGLNFALSVTVICSAYRKINDCLTETIRADRNYLAGCLARYPGLAYTLLLLLVVPAYLWVLLAAYHLPIRGVDDLYYHLPPIFHYLQTHTISMLPVEIRFHFAFPQNAELLYLWAAIFSRDTRMLDAANIPFVLISVVLIRELARFMDVPDKDAFFISLLYALCPVVLMQAGSNYIDIIVALFYLMSLYYTLKYHAEQRAIYALAAGTATGIVCGMKYTALFLTLPLQLLMIGKIVVARTRHGRLYIPPLLAFSCWWYVRNVFVLGNPFYPMRGLTSGMGFTAGGRNATLGADVLENLRTWIQAFPLADIGLGSYDGGFGAVFWGLGFPSWLCLCVIAATCPGRARLRTIILWLQVPYGFLMLLVMPKSELIYAGRYALFVVAIGLVSLGMIMTVVNSTVFRSAIKVACLVFSLLAVSLMSRSTMPLFRLEAVLDDRLAEQQPSEFKYVKDVNSVYAVLRHIWEPLDYLTRDSDAGLKCYVAADTALVALAPLYGSRLQNRLVNIGNEAGGEADALIYLAYPDRLQQGRLVKKRLCYYGYEVALEDVLTGKQFTVVTRTALGCLLVRRSLLQRPDKQRLLQSYYRHTWPEEIIAARTLKTHLLHGIPLVTADRVAYGLRALAAADEMLDAVVMVPEGQEDQVAAVLRLPACFSLGKALRGYRSVQVGGMLRDGGMVPLYLNYSKGPADA